MLINDKHTHHHTFLGYFLVLEEVEHLLKTFLVPIFLIQQPLNFFLLQAHVGYSLLSFLQRNDLIFHTALHTVSSDDDRSRLTNSVDSINSLSFSGGIPQGFHNEASTGSC